MKNYGMKVSIKHKKFKTVIVLRNVTEIHYNWESPVKELGVRLAFESDIHSDGCTYFIKNIKEFETKLEKKKAKKF